MEAPEKVYLLFNRPYLVDYTKLNKRRCEEEVEYTRTDALKQEWKPSEEQLNALHDAAVYIDKSMFPYPKGILMKLYKQLKKLSEK